jgi:hypothetical protein
MGMFMDINSEEGLGILARLPRCVLWGRGYISGLHLVRKLPFFAS